MRGQSRLLASLNVLAFEIAPIGDDIDCLDTEDFARRLGRLLQQAHVHDLVGHGLFDDQLVFGVDSHLDIVANRDARMRRHGAAVGIG